ncbi:MAG: RluA family pseudouridine synthase [Erysipelotrichaceae bacterium]|nr:RluA family pseudouridine synthase [Erysipelotrichaceae bacterium]
MSRYLTYIIKPEESGITIKDYLKKKSFSHALIANLKKYEDGIMVNGVRKYTDHHLVSDDELNVCIREKPTVSRIMATELKLSVLYEDEDLMVVEKQAGIPIHPSRLNNTETLANAVANYLTDKGIDPVFHCINRLDKDTSGLTIIAKNMYAASLLSEMIRIRTIRRDYLAICEGIFRNKQGSVCAPITRNGTSMIRYVDHENGEYAETDYQVTGEGNGLSLVRLTLKTGKTHQIRVHMKHIGHSLIGDRLYNPDNRIMDRQALHAQKLTFTHPVTGMNISITSDIPADMESVIRKYGII